MLTLVGILNVSQGLLVAFASGGVGFDRDDVAYTSATTWAAATVGLGVLLAVTAFALNRMRTGARPAAVGVIALHAITQLAMLRAYPAWSLLMVTLDVVILFILTVSRSTSTMDVPASGLVHVADADQVSLADADLAHVSDEVSLADADQPHVSDADVIDGPAPAMSLTPASLSRVARTMLRRNARPDTYRPRHKLGHRPSHRHELPAGELPVLGHSSVGHSGVGQPIVEAEVMAERIAEAEFAAPTTWVRAIGQATVPVRLALTADETGFPVQRAVLVPLDDDIDLEAVDLNAVDLEVEGELLDDDVLSPVGARPYVY